jgi:signal transduction histidine kinase/ActR/RegA family two-component response regulator
VPLLVRDRAIGVLGFGRQGSRHPFDASDLQLAEEVARRASIALENARLYRELQEADRRKDEFLAMLGHELRNPLAPISNALELLKRHSLSAAELGSLQRLMDRQVRQLVRLVDDLLDVSRITRGKIKLEREPVEIAKVIQAAVETSRPLIDARGHVLEVTVPDEPLRVLGDASRLAQVISNLLNNAAKYTEPGGRISLSAAQEEEKDLVIRVRDTGIGIPASMRSKIFDLFTQVESSLDRSQGGLGIGLTLVKQLVDKHGGSVQATSAGEGQGSEFIIRLPLLPSVPPSEPRPAPGAADKGRAYRVLVVDDNVDSADTLALLLQLSGHEVATAYRGEAALDLAVERKPQVVFLDIGLPGMDGYEVARRLRAMPFAKGMTLVAMTGYGQDNDRRRSAEAGFDLHLVKPVDLTDLEALLRGVGGPVSRRDTGKPHAR